MRPCKLILHLIFKFFLGLYKIINITDKGKIFFVLITESFKKHYLVLKSKRNQSITSKLKNDSIITLYTFQSLLHVTYFRKIKFPVPCISVNTRKNYQASLHEA